MKWRQTEFPWQPTGGALNLLLPFAVLVLFLLILIGTAHGQHDPGDMDLPIDPAHWLNFEPEPPAEPNDRGDGTSTRPVFLEPDPPTFFGEDIPADEEVVYVIDLSASMNLRGGSQNMTRLELAQQELTASIMALDEHFRFQVFTYKWIGNGMRFNRCFSQPRHATGSMKEFAVGWVMARRATGATPTGPAVAQAIQETAAATIVLLTDGAPNQPFYGTTPARCNLHRQMIVAAAGGNTKVHCFGIEDYNYFTDFLVQTAAATGGVYSHIDMP